MCFYIFRAWESYKLFATFSSNPEISSLEIEFNILWITEYYNWVGSLMEAEEAVELMRGSSLPRVK